MRTESWFQTICALSVPILLIVAGAVWSGTPHVEDFTSKQNCDVVNTTALWDTVAGELRLHPFKITFAGSRATPGFATCVAVSGNYAYVADGTNGLCVIDISTPTSPSEVSLIDTPGQALNVAVAGNLAYVADDTGGLCVVDVSTPASPVEVGLRATLVEAKGVTVSGDSVYVADAHAGVEIFRECGATVFCDGFETGDTSEWSRVAP